MLSIKRKATLINASVFILTSLLMLAVAEIVVRALFADTTVMFPRYHSMVRYGDYELRRIRPNSEFRHTSIDGSWKFVTNSQGFRNTAEFDYAKSPGTIRILSLGDSHTQGYEVRQDYTFSAITEQRLRSHYADAEVLNSGVSGFLSLIHI